MKVFYTAAHHGFRLDRVPLGGGAAVCDQLLRHWSATNRLQVEIVDPSILKGSAPQDRDLVRYSEMDYARFCLQFEDALATRLRTENPKETVILSNDVSEGPPFRLLAAQGFKIYTIYHVDVVDYVATTYLRGLVRPERLARAYTAVDGPLLRRFLPRIGSLIFSKQQDSVMYSKGLIVPSEGMRRVLLASYPSASPEKIHVVPWGFWNETVDVLELEAEKARVQTELGLKRGVFTILTLSRISPEKRQDRLLHALAAWERESDFPVEGVQLLIAGEAAFMMGQKFEKKLRTLAERLKRTRVIFTGFAAGARKQALFKSSDLYVFPSEHESYGLTLLEAMQAGLPVLACRSHGTTDVVRPEVGKLVPPTSESGMPAAICASLKRLFNARARLPQMGKEAQTYAHSQRFEMAAERVAQILLQA